MRVADTSVNAPKRGSRAERTIVSQLRNEGLPMLGAILVILSLIAGAAYVAKVGTGFTLLFIGAVVFMAYKRLPLIAFTVVFTLLLAGLHLRIRARRARASGKVSCGCCSRRSGCSTCAPCARP